MQFRHGDHFKEPSTTCGTTSRTVHALQGITSFASTGMLSALSPDIVRTSSGTDQLPRTKPGGQKPNLEISAVRSSVPP
jgi:hypothetical protein